MTLFEKTKVALRISTNALDMEIADNIETAKEELIRAGVSADAVSEEGSLVTRAVTTFVLMVMAPDLQTSEGYARSFELQCDNLRKSTLTNTEE